MTVKRSSPGTEDVSCSSGLMQLLCSPNLLERPARVRLQNPVAQIGIETRRQHAIVESGRFAARDGPEIGTRPEEVIGFGHDDP